MDDFNSLMPDVEYFVHRKCHPEWEIIKSVIDFHDVSYLVAGKGFYYIDGTEVAVKAGDVIHINPGSLREAKSDPDEPMELFAINFHLADGESLPFKQLNHLGRDPKLINLFNQFTRVWIEKNDLYEIEARAITLQVLCELIRRLCRHKPAAVFDPRVERVKDYIHENYSSPMTVKSLAAEVNLNDVYLGALFKRVVGATVNSYINNVRVSHATDILIAEKTNVQDVAYRCGFTDAFYFCRVFKKYKGYPPSEISKHYFLA